MCYCEPLNLSKFIRNIVLCAQFVMGRRDFDIDVSARAKVRLEHVRRQVKKLSTPSESCEVLWCLPLFLSKAYVLCHIRDAAPSGCQR